MPTENRSSNTEMVSAAPAPKRNRIYVEVRECEGCNHIGINDAHSAVGACHECDWSGPEPVEDKCPGCGRENVMAAATGLPIVGLGPMTDSSEVERLVVANTEYARRHLELQGEVERLRQEVASIDKKLRGNVSDPDPLKPIMPGALSVTTTYGLVAGIVRERDQLKKALERQPS